MYKKYQHGYRKHVEIRIEDESEVFHVHIYVCIDTYYNCWILISTKLTFEGRFIGIQNMLLVCTDTYVRTYVLVQKNIIDT